jgi:hypothetical protein
VLADRGPRRGLCLERSTKEEKKIWPLGSKILTRSKPPDPSPNFTAPALVKPRYRKVTGCFFSCKQFENFPLKKLSFF